jgi:hypothetical protein
MAGQILSRIRHRMDNGSGCGSASRKRIRIHIIGTGYLLFNKTLWLTSQELLPCCHKEVVQDRQQQGKRRETAPWQDAGEVRGAPDVGLLPLSVEPRVLPPCSRCPQHNNVKNSVADPESGAFLTPGSGIRNRFFPDPGSLTHIFESVVTIFWVKSSKKFFKLAKFFSSAVKKWNNLQFCEICGYKKSYDNKFFFTPLFCCCFWIRDPGWVKIKDPGSGINIPDPQHWLRNKEKLESDE